MDPAPPRRRPGRRGTRRTDAERWPAAKRDPGVGDDAAPPTSRCSSRHDRASTGLVGFDVTDRRTLRRRPAARACRSDHPRPPDRDPTGRAGRTRGPGSPLVGPAPDGSGANRGIATVPTGATANAHAPTATAPTTVHAATATTAPTTDHAATATAATVHTPTAHANAANARTACTAATIEAIHGPGTRPTVRANHPGSTCDAPSYVRPANVGFSLCGAGTSRAGGDPVLSQVDGARRKQAGHAGAPIRGRGRARQ